MDRSDAYDRRGAANMMYRETFKCSRTNTFLVELFFEKNYIENYTFFPQNFVFMRIPKNEIRLYREEKETKEFSKIVDYHRNSSCSVRMTCSSTPNFHHELKKKNQNRIFIYIFFSFSTNHIETDEFVLSIQSNAHEPI